MLIGIMRRIIDIMKTENVPIHAHPSMLSAFRIIAESTTSPDMYRSVALYITSAVQTKRDRVRRRSSINRNLSGATSTSRRSQLNSTLETSGIQQSRDLVSNGTGVSVLTAFTTLLCEDVNASHVKRFAKHVTNKVGP